MVYLWDKIFNQKSPPASDSAHSQGQPVHKLLWCHCHFLQPHAAPHTHKAELSSPGLRELTVQPSTLDAQTYPDQTGNGPVEPQQLGSSNAARHQDDSEKKVTPSPGQTPPKPKAASSPICSVHWPKPKKTPDANHYSLESE